MQPLFHYSIQNPHLSPPEALQQLVSTFPQNAGIGYGQGYPLPQQPGTQRSQSINGPVPAHFASPASMHLGLPGAQGSPHLGGPAHTPSPAQNSMQIGGSVPMAPQQSQPGTNTSGSQGTSANTSPNVNNKRRRSTVKLEDESSATADVNGSNAPPTSKVKASPRVGGKRQKGTA